MQIAGTSLRPLELWRPDVTLHDARNFAGALAAAAVRAGSGARVTFAGPRPTDVIVLYERESCAHSRLVRETLSELDVDALIKPCPPGETQHNRELRDVSGKGEVPFLIDRSTRVSLSDSARIVGYLTERYGSHAAPCAPYCRGGPVSLFASPAAWREFSDSRLGHPTHVASRSAARSCHSSCGTTRPRPTAASCASVSGNSASPTSRGQISARHSPEARGVSRRALDAGCSSPTCSIRNTHEHRHVFESESILRYLTDTYASCFDAVPAEIGGHPA